MEQRADKRASAHDNACKRGSYICASRVTHTPQSSRSSIILPSGHDRPYLSDFSPSTRRRGSSLRPLPRPSSAGHFFSTHWTLPASLPCSFEATLQTMKETLPPPSFAFNLVFGRSLVYFFNQAITIYVILVVLYRILTWAWIWMGVKFQLGFGFDWFFCFYFSKPERRTLVVC